MTDWTRRAVTPDEAVSCVQSGMRVFVHGAAATPTPLVEALARRTRPVRRHAVPHAHDGAGAVRGAGARRTVLLDLAVRRRARCARAIAEGRADYVPIFLSDIPALFTSRARQARRRAAAGLAARRPRLLHARHVGRHGARRRADRALRRSRRSTSDAAHARQHARAVFAPSHACVHTDRALPEHAPSPPSPVEDAIGEHVAALVPDRATLQMGIGAIPDAVLRRLFDKHDLGVHTEMFSDGIVDLVEAGVVTNQFKRVHPGRIATSFVMGTQRLYDFVDDNPFVEFYPCDRTNDTSRHPAATTHVVAINSAIEVDLSGPGRGRLDRLPDLLGHRRADGLHPRRGALGGRQADHRAAVDGRRRQACRASCRRSSPAPASSPRAGTCTGSSPSTARSNLFGKTLRERGRGAHRHRAPRFPRASSARAFAETRHVVLAERVRS